MNKYLLTVLCVLNLYVLGFSAAPELRNVLPNSWEKLTEVTAEKKDSAIRVCEDALQKVYDTYKYGINISVRTQFTIKNIYSQNEEGTVFYRILLTDEENYGKNVFVQVLCTETGTLLMTGLYGARHGGKYYTYSRFDSIDIIKRGNGEYGLLCTKMTVPIEDDRNFAALVKKQIAGKQEAMYVIVNDLEKVTTQEIDWNLLPTNPYVRISASDCLVDKTNPLKYGLQNAFDGNPATSYVENTEDDLMKIKIDIGLYIEKLMIINGYAQNYNLYLKNNRIKALAPEKAEKNNNAWFFSVDVNRKVILEDNNTNKQYVPFDDYCVYITDIYKGDIYSDTCIAELNIKIKDGIWLFGDEDE